MQPRGPSTEAEQKEPSDLGLPGSKTVSKINHISLQLPGLGNFVMTIENRLI
jgi:hypothetical protein